MEQRTLPEPRVIEASEEAVLLVAHGPMDHERHEVQEGGRTVTRCGLYPNLECEDHKRSEEALGPYLRGTYRIPIMIWIDAEGKERFRRSGFRPPEEFIKDLRQALDQIPGPRISKSEYAALVRPLDEALAARGGERWKEAAEKFAEAARGSNEAVRREAEAGLQELRAKGEALLQEAEAQAKAGWLDVARATLNLLAQEFSALECGAKAAERVRELGDPPR
ncbi:MAG: hypothetical protein HY716_13440 [Planctomycetes bacterium]|nr:hypothetical protein [Planctomycetota bacterium]